MSEAVELVRSIRDWCMVCRAYSDHRVIITPTSHGSTHYVVQVCAPCGRSRRWQG